MSARNYTGIRLETGRCCDARTPGEFARVVVVVADKRRRRVQRMWSLSRFRLSFFSLFLFSTVSVSLKFHREVRSDMSNSHRVRPSPHATNISSIRKLNNCRTRFFFSSLPFFSYRPYANNRMYARERVKRETRSLVRTNSIRLPIPPHLVRSLSLFFSLIHTLTLPKNRNG